MEIAQPSPADRPKVERRKDPQRSRMANGSELLPGVDGRSLWARRLRELLHEHVSDLGGEANLSASEMALVRRGITLIVECERREVGFAQAGQVSDDALSIYQTTVNTLRRTFEAVGLKRRPREIVDEGVLEFEQELQRLEAEDAQPEDPS